MNLIAMKLARNEEVLKCKLRHWFRFDHLQPEQGIAFLICFALDYEDEKDVVDWSKNEVKILRFGLPLLNGNKMCSWLEIEPNDECIQLNAVNCTQGSDYLFSRETSHTIFAISAQQHKRLLQYWESRKHPELTPLKYFVEWSKKKDFVPEWISAAIELGLIQEKTSINNGSHSIKQVNADSDRIRQLKHIAALSLTLAHISKKYKKGDKPNALAVARDTVELLDLLPDSNTRGVGMSSIRESIKDGLALFSQ